TLMPCPPATMRCRVLHQPGPMSVSLTPHHRANRSVLTRDTHTFLRQIVNTVQADTFMLGVGSHDNDAVFDGWQCFFVVRQTVKPVELHRNQKLPLQIHQPLFTSLAHQQRDRVVLILSWPMRELIINSIQAYVSGVVQPS